MQQAQDKSKRAYDNVCLALFWGRGSPLQTGRVRGGGGGERGGWLGLGLAPTRTEDGYGDGDGGRV